MLRQERGILIFIVLFFMTQVYHTVRNQTHWPFSPMNLFHHLSSPKRKAYFVRLCTPKGNCQRVHSKYVVPIEQFRIHGVLSDVYSHGSAHQKEAYARNLLSILNAHPTGFSLLEIYPSARPPAGENFVSFELDEDTFDTTDYDGQWPMHPIHSRHVYHFSGGPRV